MPRTVCRACGATIDVARDRSTAENVPLDPAPDASSDAQRYRYVSDGVVEPVSKDARGSFLPDHRFDCPGYGAGRTTRDRP